MIVRRLLVGGMLAGILAGLLAAFFARLVVEPSVDLAIGYEAAREAAHHHMADEPALVSRAVQKGAGLIVATTVYGAALGGIFALVFAGLNGRVLRGNARAGAAWLALAAFVAISLVPALKYPPNPPAVGLAETIALRTVAFFAMILLSVASAALAVRIARDFRSRFEPFDARLSAIALYAVAMIVAASLLPAIDEVPRDFPPRLLWDFRLGSLMTQASLWTCLGLVFGKIAEREIEARRATG